jgi:AcrR family transcriptional regulator
MPAIDPPATRRFILEAAEELLRDQGLAATTTRAIAERAGCAEGTIYRHFPDKQALIVEIVHTRFPGFLELVASLPERAGTGSVRANLEELGASALAFYRAVLPLIVGLFSDHKLVLQQREHFRQRQTGPLRVLDSLVAYLRAEQGQGRVSPDVSPEHLARALLGSLFLQAFLEELLGADARLGADEDFVRGTITSLRVGAEPPAAAI